MNQRLVAATVAVPLVLAMLVYAGVAPLPYATYAPGTTINVLGTDADDAEIIQVDGAKTYRDDGQLRMTTVSLSRPRSDLGLISLMGTWFDPDEAVLPYGAVYGEEETPDTTQRDGAVQMVTSQDAAIEVALRKLGYDVPTTLSVVYVEKGLPADGKLRVRDEIRSVDGDDVTSPQQLATAVKAAGDQPIEIGIVRGGKRERVSVTPREVDGSPLIGVTSGVGYDFPFDVSVNIDPRIGGPSAGLVFSLAIYDTLTPGSLTGGHAIAGTGEIEPDGTVGPIGGIAQKIAGARDEGAELFLVPADNCAAALDADPGDMRLMRADSMSDVVDALESYADDTDADLPTCQDAV